ncbi:MAG: hypothetical protein ACYDHW_15810 [Syntrophorhabdaceae bacterium]
MVNKTYNAVVERNVVWSGEFASEPYECGWAREAIIFIRSLKGGSSTTCRVQISADGIRWCDEGSIIKLPQNSGETTWCRVSHFGNWLRVVGDMGKDEVTVLVTLSLKS